MKLSSLATLVAASVLLAACNSLDNPFTNLFHGNHDGRVYDPQTGQWNYPAGSATPSPQKSAAVASTLASTPAPQSTGGGGRYFDPQKNQWVEMHNADSPSPSDPHSAASPAASATASAPAVVAPPRPARDSGIYNPSTGKIEWQSAGGPAPSYGAVARPTSAPANAKHWWWPFGSAPPDRPVAAPTPAPANAKHWWWPFGSAPSDRPVAAPTPAPANVKHWWWPF